MKLYRIYTERTKALPAQIEAASKLFPGFTLLEAQGYWQGQAEPSVIFEIVAPEGKDTQDSIACLAMKIEQLGQQEAVLVTVQDVVSLI
jgi:hypothetical protein